MTPPTMATLNTIDEYRNKTDFLMDDASWVPQRRIITISPLDFIKNDLRRLAALEHNWDTYGAPPINADILASVERFVTSLYAVIDFPKPTVVPCSNGGVQLEWNRDNKTLELEFESPDTVHYLRWQPADGIEDEDLCPVSNTCHLVRLVKWFIAESEVV